VNIKLKHFQTSILERKEKKTTLGTDEISIFLKYNLAHEDLNFRRGSSILAILPYKLQKFDKNNLRKTLNNIGGSNDD